MQASFKKFIKRSLLKLTASPIPLSLRGVNYSLPETVKVLTPNIFPNNKVFCNLNFDAGSTFVHYVERSLKVPYRFDKSFSGIFRRKGKEERGGR